MLKRTGLKRIGLCLVIAVGWSAPAAAEPGNEPPPPAVEQPVGPEAAPGTAPVDTGAVVSGAPGVANLLDGRTLTVAAKDETQLPVAPLTTSLSSRDWLVGATFTGTTTGSVNGGTLEVGYQIGCGIEMDKVRLIGQLGIDAGDFQLGADGFDVFDAVAAPIQGQIRVEPRPGTVTKVMVNKKTFQGTSARVTLKDIHIGVDNCVGASSLRSYAILTSSGIDEDDIVGYYGTTKVF